MGAGMPQGGPTWRVAWTNAMAQCAYVAETSEGGIDVFLTPEQTMLHSADPTMGWGHLCSGDIAVYHVQGNHLNLFQEPQVLELSAILAERLDQVDAQGGGGNV